MRNRSPRIITRVIVFVLLGAIVNVAVAWGCAALVEITLVDETFEWSLAELTGSKNWHVVGLHKPGASRFIYERSWRGDDDSVRLPAELPHWASQALKAEYASTQSMAMLLDARGWPWRSMYALGNYDRQSIRRGILLREGPEGWYTENFALPLGIIWPGFAINAVFYAVILWVLFAAPFALRRRRRIRRGLCPACAYDLRGSASQMCPECGKAVVKQKAEKQKAEMT